MIYRELNSSEYDLLKTFLYEAIFIPEGVTPPDRSIVELPELALYYDNFGSEPADFCVVAEVEDVVVGAAWTRIMNDYGHIDNETPSLAMSVLKDYRSNGIGTRLLQELITLLNEKGYRRLSLSVQKANYAVHMYERAGFRTIQENADEYIMVCDLLSESELYKELGILTKDRSKWEENIPYVSSLLSHESEKIKAKALWLLGEMGLVYPMAVQDAVPIIANFLDSPVSLLRERAVNALGRIGRGSYQVIEPHWASLFRFASDEEAKVRLSFIWASENIATNTPDVYENYMPVFEKFLYDENDKVRMEAPEMFRVLGKRRPGFVRPYLEKLRQISETDSNDVVRIHCLGAIRAIEPEIDDFDVDEDIHDPCLRFQK